MPENADKARQTLQTEDGTEQLCLKTARDHGGQKSLRHVEEQADDAESRTADTKDIGESGISASGVQNINPEIFRDHHGKRDCSPNICKNKVDDNVHITLGAIFFGISIKIHAVSIV